MPYLWLGDEERGLAWFAESDEGWHLSNPAAALSVSTQGQVVTGAKHCSIMRKRSRPPDHPLRLAGKPGEAGLLRVACKRPHPARHSLRISRPRPGWPVRTGSASRRGVKTVVIHDSWTKYFGQMIPADAARFRRLIDACHQHRKLKLLVYVGYGIARSAEIQGKHDEWSVLPLIPWDPGYKPETRGFDATCATAAGPTGWSPAPKNSSASTTSTASILTEPCPAWTCRTPSRLWLGKTRKATCTLCIPSWQRRQLMRRLADTVHRRRPDAILDVHMSSNMTLPTLAFCDVPGTENSLKCIRPARSFQSPSCLSHRVHGVCARARYRTPLSREPPVHLLRSDRASVGPWRRGAAVSEEPVAGHADLAPLGPLRRSEGGLATVPWSNPPATADSDDVKVASHGPTRAPRRLLFVSHLQRKPLTAHVRLDRRRLNLKPGQFTPKALTAAAIDVKDDTIELALDGMNYRMIVLTE